MYGTSTRSHTTVNHVHYCPLRPILRLYEKQKGLGTRLLTRKKTLGLAFAWKPRQTPDMSVSCMKHAVQSNESMLYD